MADFERLRKDEGKKTKKLSQFLKSGTVKANFAQIWYVEY